jgi:hypothetical protein
MTKLTRKTKVPLTNRQKLWKQVNKKVRKVVYTFNPNLYDHSLFYEVDPPTRQRDTTTTIADCYNDDSFKWSNVISNIDWSGMETLHIEENCDIDLNTDEAKIILPPFDFDTFQIDGCNDGEEDDEDEDEDIAYEKMWN